MQRLPMRLPSRLPSRLRSLALGVLKVSLPSLLGVASCAAAFAFTAPQASAQAAPPFGPSIPSPPGDKNVFYFTPWGSQLDADNTPSSFFLPRFHVPTSALDGFQSFNVYDLEAEPGQAVDFDVYFYQTSPYYTTGDIFEQAAFPVGYNTTEWSLISFSPPLVTGITLAHGPFANPFLYRQIKGVAVNPGYAPDDGEPDFMVRLARIDLNGFTSQVANVSGQFQTLELQRKNPSSVAVPAPLPAVGLLAAWRLARKARLQTLKRRSASPG